MSPYQSSKKSKHGVSSKPAKQTKQTTPIQNVNYEAYINPSVPPPTHSIKLNFADIDFDVKPTEAIYGRKTPSISTGDDDYPKYKKRPTLFTLDDPFFTQRYNPDDNSKVEKPYEDSNNVCSQKYKKKNKSDWRFLACDAITANFQLTPPIPGSIYHLNTNLEKHLANYHESIKNGQNKKIEKNEYPDNDGEFKIPEIHRISPILPDENNNVTTDPANFCQPLFEAVDSSSKQRYSKVWDWINAQEPLGLKFPAKPVPLKSAESTRRKKRVNKEELQKMSVSMNLDAFLGKVLRNSATPLRDENSGKKKEHCVTFEDQVEHELRVEQRKAARRARNKSGDRNGYETDTSRVAWANTTPELTPSPSLEEKDFLGQSSDDEKIKQTQACSLDFNGNKTNKNDEMDDLSKKLHEFFSQFKTKEETPDVVSVFLKNFASRSGSNTERGTPVIESTTKIATTKSTAILKSKSTTKAKKPSMAKVYPQQVKETNNNDNKAKPRSRPRNIKVEKSRSQNGPVTLPALHDAKSDTSKKPPSTSSKKLKPGVISNAFMVSNIKPLVKTELKKMMAKKDEPSNEETKIVQPSKSKINNAKTPNVQPTPRARPPRKF